MGEHLTVNRSRQRETRHSGHHSGSFEPCRLQLPKAEQDASHNSPLSDTTRVNTKKTVDERFAFLPKNEGLQNQPDGKNYSIESDGTIVLRTNSDAFRFNYALGGSSNATSLDKNFESLHTSKSNASEQITKRSAADRYTYTVTKLPDGQFEYRIKLNPNCQGMRMDFGDGKSYQFEAGVTQATPTPSATERYNSDVQLPKESSQKPPESSAEEVVPTEEIPNPVKLEPLDVEEPEMILGPRPRFVNHDL